MRLCLEVNQYVSDQAPWALVKTDRERAATVLYVVAARGRQPEDRSSRRSCRTPRSSVHELLGYDGWLAGPLEFREVDEDGDARTRS